MPFLGKNPTAGFSTIVKDDLTPDGSTTAFTLSKQVASANDIAVFVGNVRQEPTDAYSVSGTTLTMTAAPASGLNFYVLHIAGTLESSVIPADGTITSAKLDTNIDVAGTLDVTGATTLDSGLTVDTSTLVVDATTNRVGIGMTSMEASLDVLGNSDTTAALKLNGGNDNHGFHFYTSGSNGDLIIKREVGGTQSESFRINRSNGSILTTEQPAFIAYRSSDVTLVYTNNFITYDATTRNNGSHYNTSNGRFTAPVAGVYYFFAKSNVDTNNTIENKFVVNGTEIVRTYFPNMGANQRTCMLSSMVYLNASDYVQFNCYNASNSGTNRLLGSNNTIQSHVGGYLVG